MQKSPIVLTQLFMPLFNYMFLISAIIIIIVLIKKYTEYKNSAYYEITKRGFLSVRFNIGIYGEYLTYKCLKKFEANGAKFLFNIYVPKENGENSEIDVLMICKKGIFVFESKNYSGWIFGSENQKNWYQTLPNGKGRSRKEQFYNPIMQNRSHIKHLKAFLGEQVPVRSIIVFSDRCTLQSVQIFSNDISVINRRNTESVISDILNNEIPNDLLTDNDITDIYNKLYPYTQVDKTFKTRHIANINRKLNPQTIQKNDETSTQTFLQNRAETVLKQQKTVGVDEISEPTQTDNAERQKLKCPKCNGDLILRTASRGANLGKQFYGCSNYPKCKYTKSITQ